MKPLAQSTSLFISFSKLSFRVRLSIIALVFWIILILIQDFDWGKGALRAMLLVLVLVTTLILMKLVQRSNQPTPHRVSVVLAVICTLLICWHFYRFVYHSRPKLIDIGATTLAAADALREGKNPYTTPINPIPELDTNQARYDGYKYLPVMALTYLPLGTLLRERGVFITNLLLDLATAGLIFRLGSQIGSSSSGLFSVLLFMMLPLVPIEIFKFGVTDLCAIVPLLIALLWVERRPALAGLCVGLSVSAKLLPGAVFVPCCLPAIHRGWYAAGIAIGLVPTLFFLALSPNELISNILVFNAVRSTDSTSWLDGMPPEIHLITKIVVALVLLGVAMYVWFKRPTIADRCGLGVICILSVMLCGPTNHRNYQLWWLPLFTVLLGAASFCFPTPNAPNNEGGSESKRPIGVEQTE